MSLNNKSGIDNFIRGSDTLWHSIQMFGAGLKRITIISLVATICIFFITISINTNSIQREILFKHYLAVVCSKAGLNFDITLPTPDGPRKAAPRVAAIATEAAASDYAFYLMFSTIFSIAIGFALGMKISKYQIRRGEEEAEDMFLRGQKLIESHELAKLTGEKASLGFKIGDVPIPDALLARNFAFVGSQGTGKSEGIYCLADTARKHTKAVVYDVTGEYTERYYDPTRGDIILNPFDLRCASWSIFSDIRSEIDYSTFATYFNPKHKSETDPIWSNAASILLEDVLKIVQLEPTLKKTMGEVARIAMTIELAELAMLLKKHKLPSSGTVTAENEKTSLSIRMHLAAQPALRFFKLFDVLDSVFSIRKFVESDSKGWLFIPSKPEQHEAIKPFASAWLEMAMLAAMSGRPINHTRIMFFIDELKSLAKLNALEVGLTQARKFGICTVIGFQNMAQVEDVYGSEMSRVLIANAQTKVIYRTDEVDSAKSLSDGLGKKEIDEASGSLQFGIESTKDGSNISRKRSEINIVMPSQIQTLPDLTAYIKVAGSYPVALINVPYKTRPFVAPAYELRVMAALGEVHVPELLSPPVMPTPTPFIQPRPSIQPLMTEL